MNHLITNLLGKFRNWETSAQIGFGLALLLIIPVFLIGYFGPETLRTPALISIMGLIIVAQVIFMWAQRHMVTPFTRAQRHYLRGEFEQVCDVLHELKERGKADIYALTLLGNNYRQLGDLDTSESILYEALNMNPDHYFPLYGFGRTLLSRGRYEEAIDTIHKAIKNGAESVVQFDLAEAYFRAGDADEAEKLLTDLMPQLVAEPHRHLMAQYILYLSGRYERPSSDLIRHGLPYWEHHAQLFAHTPYGQALDRDVQELKNS